MGFVEFILWLMAAVAVMAAVLTIVQALAEQATQEIKMAEANGRLAYFITTARWLATAIFIIYACSKLLN